MAVLVPAILFGGHSKHAREKPGHDEEWESRSGKWELTAKRPNFSSAMSRLYHYTSVNGLRGIIDSGNIWATHLGFLNDLSEGKAALAEADWRRQLEEADKRAPIFIASFCRHQEPHQLKNGLLSQWRGYAGEGGGYCVVFDEEALDNLVEAERRISPGLTIVKKDIRYLGDGAEQPPANGADLLDLAAFVKSEAFREENETRITLAVPHRGPRPIRFREAAEMLIPYVEIFSGRRQLPITEVIVGPGPLQRRCAAGIVQFLRAHGLDVSVRLSEIPLAR